MKKAEMEKNEGWGAVSLPEGMYIQFFPKKGDASPTYKGISVKFPDGTVNYPPKSKMYKAARGSLFYSLSCSCRLCGVNFFEYLSDVLDKVSLMNPFAPTEQFRELLPDRWSKAQ